MDVELSLKKMQKSWHGSIKAYMIGFFGSLILTSISFGLVTFELLPRQDLLYAISGLALVQAIIQLRYFLHLGKEEHPRWETFIFCFMFMVLLIIALGSLWIMHDLNMRMM